MTTLPTPVFAKTIDERKIRIVPAPFTEQLKCSIDLLYKNTFCSATHANRPRHSGPIWAFVIEKNKAVKQIILFTKKRSELTVLHELVTLSHEVVHDFAQHIFGEYQEINSINFPSIRTEAHLTSYPTQRHDSTEDIVALLPTAVEAYLPRLSKNTRDSIRRYQKRINQDHPEIEFHFYNGELVPTEQLLQIIDLSRARIRQKGQTPAHTEETVAHLRRMVSKYGVTLIATRYGQVCGGVICTQIHEHVYMHVIAHDPCLDHLRLGKICCYLSICDAITRGCTEYHMLSGEYNYKYQLLGEKKTYEKLTLYRSKLAILLNAKMYLSNEVYGKGRRVKRALREWKNRRSGK